MSALYIDREGIHNKLFLLGTVAGLMADIPENFGDTELYAMQELLYQIAKEVFPEWKQRGKQES